MRKTLIKNLMAILFIDLVVLPLAIILYLKHGFNIVHVVFSMAYIYGLVLVYKTAALLAINMIMSDEIIQDDSDTDETLKPEMKKAMDEVFGLKRQ